MKNTGTNNYSKEVIRHFTYPKNMGEMKNPDAVGELGNPICGDVMKIYLKVDKKTRKIRDIKFQTMGCAAAIATSSMITEIEKEKQLNKQKRLQIKMLQTLSKDFR